MPSNYFSNLFMSLLGILCLCSSLFTQLQIESRFCIVITGRSIKVKRESHHADKNTSDELWSMNADESSGKPVQILIPEPTHKLWHGSKLDTSWMESNKMLKMLIRCFIVIWSSVLGIVKMEMLSLCYFKLVLYFFYGI